MLNFAKTYPVYGTVKTVNDEGTKIERYEPKGSIRATVYPASSRRMTEVYGNRLQSMLSALTEDETIQPGDALSVYQDDPDFKVVGKSIYSRHVELDLEKL